MSTLRINNIEAQSVPASPTIDEKVKVTNSSGDILVNIDGKTSGITTIGINTTDGNIKFDANSNVLITGILTATTLAGNFTPDSLEVGSNIKLGNAGVITATSFVGSGANLTSLPAANLTGTLPAISGANLTGINTAFGNSSVNSSGIATFSQVKTLNGTTSLNKHSVGIGTTTTAGRNAGVSTATGELIFNSTTAKVQIYTGNLWLDLVSTFSATGGSTSTVSGYKYHTFTSSGAFVVSSGQATIDSLVVAGGGGGSGGSGNSGGLHGCLLYTSDAADE